MRSDRHKKKKKKWLKPLLIIVSALVIILIAGAGYYAYRLHNFISDISVSREITDENEQADFQRINDKKPFSILLLGVDLEDGLTSRTDSIMVATVNPDTKDTKLVSIPRDTLVETNFGFTEKINAMHTFGGIELMITEVEKLMDIPIAHYAILDFQGLAALVDAVGGIEIYSDMAFTESNSLNYEDPIEIEEGLQTLNGEEALGFSRMRKKDIRGDFGRQERQQMVIKALADELTTMNIVTNFYPILDAVSPYLQTNLNGSQILTLAMNYREAAYDIETYQLSGVDTVEYFPHYGLNVFAFVPDEEVLSDVTSDLQDHLGVHSRYTNTRGLQTDDNLETDPE